MRPTISLCMIMKNEEKNLPILLKSVEGMFDEICITDTGSTDNSVEVAKSLGAKVSHFEWIRDFAAARNYSFEQASCDYVMWLDLDDHFLPEDRENFINWRNEAMSLADYWMARYVYASHADGTPACSFSRERVVKRELNNKWKYFIHEGIVPVPGQSVSYTPVWSVTHRRTVEDIIVDKGRNLSIFEAYKGELDARMQYYYAKELYEAGKPMEAYGKFVTALKNESLELHDRILGHQYAGTSAFHCNQYAEAINLAHLGLQLSPQRAEFYNLIADSHIKQNNPLAALPFYQAAKNCNPTNLPDSKMPTALFAQPNLYGEYPMNQVARIYFNQGRFQEALEEAKKCYELYKSDESKALVGEFDKAVAAVNLNEAVDCEDIVLTCPPNIHSSDWDEEMAKTKGMGGSETAAIEVCKSLKKLTGRSVKIFNGRTLPLVSKSGVEYLPISTLNEYMGKNKPKLHISWRHNIECTKARTIAWSHDLIIPGADNTKVYEKIMVLSKFHKRFVKSVQGLPDDKIMVTRNGIMPEKFLGLDLSVKKPSKVVWLSSPDRGLKEAIRVLDKARTKIEDIELHVFYGFDGMYKVGAGKAADELKDMIEARPWITYHGFTQQNTLAESIKDASIWLYPSTYQETFCISALEAIALGIFPIVKDFGALKDTLEEFIDEGMAQLVTRDCKDEEDETFWANLVIDAILEKKWQKIKNVDLGSLSWDAVAKEWAKEFDL